LLLTLLFPTLGPRLFSSAALRLISAGLAFRELAQGICFAEGFPRNLAFAFTHYLSERPENEAKQQEK
jgi:hypothetical protein